MQARAVTVGASDECAKPLWPDISNATLDLTVRYTPMEI
jgi:hypothetical protein